MAKFISNDLLIYISKAGATFTDAEATAISTAKPAVITGTPGALVEGDVVAVKTTGVASLDDKMFAAGAPSGATVGETFSLVGTDTTAEAGTTAAFDGTGGTDEVAFMPAASMTKICLREMEIGQATTSEVDASDFCNEATLPGPSTPGPVTFTGYVDTTSDAYIELKAAADDGIERVIKFVGPNKQYWVGKVTIGDLSWSFPRGDVCTFSATGTQSLKLQHRF